MGITVSVSCFCTFSSVAFSLTKWPIGRRILILLFNMLFGHRVIFAHYSIILKVLYIIIYCILLLWFVSISIYGKFTTLIQNTEVCCRINIFVRNIFNLFNSDFIFTLLLNIIKRGFFLKSYKLQNTRKLSHVSHSLVSPP